MGELGHQQEQLQDVVLSQARQQVLVQPGPMVSPGPCVQAQLSFYIPPTHRQREALVTFLEHPWVSSWTRRRAALYVHRACHLAHATTFSAC